MRWRAVVVALERAPGLRSRASVHLHPLAGCPIVWHVVRAILDVKPAPSSVIVLHDVGDSVDLGNGTPDVTYEAVPRGDAARALRFAVGTPGLALIADGAAPLVDAPSYERLLGAAEAQGTVACIAAERDGRGPVAIAGDGMALAAPPDPRRPDGATCLTLPDPATGIRITDRHDMARAAMVVHERLIRQHEERGVSFLLPMTTWVDLDVRIGADTLVYPGCVLEGATVIGSECVIGPHSRLIEAHIGRGAELKGWNYVARTSIRNHAVLEPHERRGLD